jgi:hypothetical protein
MEGENSSNRYQQPLNMSGTYIIQTQHASVYEQVRFTVRKLFVDTFVSSAVFNKILIAKNPQEILIGYQNPMNTP